MGSTIAQDSVSFMFYEKARSVFLLFRVASPSPVLAPVGRGHASVIIHEAQRSRSCVRPRQVSHVSYRMDDWRALQYCTIRLPPVSSCTAFSVGS